MPGVKYRCETCYWFDPLDKQERNNQSGLCRIHAPGGKIDARAAHADMVWAWPIVVGDVDFCSGHSIRGDD